MRHKMKNRIKKLVASMMVLVTIMLAVSPVTVNAATASVIYRTHIQNIGDTSEVRDGATSGTVGRELRLENIRIRLSGVSGNIFYRVHCQDVGWTSYVSDGKMAGFQGLSRRVEAVQIYLTGEAAKIYDVYYRTHVQNIGWMQWVKNNAVSGTTGQSLRAEAVEIKLVPKASASVGITSNSNFDPIWPCANTFRVTCLYKYSSGSAHSSRFKNGMDIAAPAGENVLAVESGKVICSEYSTTSGFGNWIMIEHSNGKVSLYAHLKNRKVSAGQTVSKGQIIGQVGNTSAKYNIGAHLHFELGNGNTSGASGDPYQEYYKTKYAGKIKLEQAAKKYNTP